MVGKLRLASAQRVASSSRSAHPLLSISSAVIVAMAASHGLAQEAVQAVQAELDTWELPTAGQTEEGTGRELPASDQPIASSEPAATPDVRAVYGPPAPSAGPGEIVFDAPPGVPDVLLNLVSRAVSTHPEVRTTEADLEAARADIRGARWLRFPSLTVEALAATRGSANASGDFFAPNVVVDQPLWDAGRISANVDRAEATALVRTAAIEESIRDIALRTVQAYYDVALASRRQAILEEGLAQHRLLLETISNRVEQEVSPRSDLALAQSRTAQIEQDIATAKSQILSGYYRLMELTGDQDPELGAVPPYDPNVHHPFTPGVVERALSCDPTITRTRAEVQVAEAEYKIAKAQVYPQLSAQLSQNEITGTRFGLALRAQTGGGLSRLSASTAARSRIESSEFTIFSAERALREELRADFVLNETASSRITAGRTASESANVVTESYRRQFIAGRRTWLDVMNAVREATNSQLVVADSEVAAMASTARIWLRSCGWAPQPSDESATPE